ncbi:MAG: class B sortase [Coriobacteriaceae bacterium]|nr:class B sortase [Coriobacteriaceae bacterium]
MKGSRFGQIWHNRAPIILMVIGVLCLVVALVIAGFKVFEYLDASGRYQQIEELAGIDTDTQQSIKVIEEELLGLDVDWEALRAINPDVVAWIVIPETKINYPIVQADDNEYYLDHLFDRSSSKVGAIFLDVDSSVLLDGKNNIIYGHNMNDGSMFADITRYVDSDFFDKHRTIYIATPNMNYELQAEFAFVCDAGAEIAQFDFADHEQFSSFVTGFLAEASVSRVEDVNQIDQLFCLATCSYQYYDARTILCASVVKSYEPT